MSYDFDLTRPKLQESNRFLEPSIVNLQAYNTDRENLRLYLIESLLKVNEQLQVKESDYVYIASISQISVTEAKINYGHLELDSQSGIQICLALDEAWVTIPYIYDKEKSESLFKELWQYFVILTNAGNYEIYDPQLNKTIDLSTDYYCLLTNYNGIVFRLYKQW